MTSNWWTGFALRNFRKSGDGVLKIIFSKVFGIDWKSSNITLVSCDEEFDVVNLGICCGEDGGVEVAKSWVHGCCFALAEGVAVRFLAIKLAWVRLAKKLF